MKNSRQKIWKAALAIGTLIWGGAMAMPVGAAGTIESMEATSAWGPSRDVYTWAEPADHIVFNSIKDNPSLGEEVNFVRVCELEAGACKTQASGEKYVDSLDAVAGKTYQVYVYFHNNASASLNASAVGSIGLARNPRLLISMPSVVPQGANAKIKGTIRALGKDAAGEGKMVIKYHGEEQEGQNEVWDTAYLKAKDTPLALEVVANSVVLHNGAGVTPAADGKKYDPMNGIALADGTVLSRDAMLSSDGVMLSYYDYGNALGAGVVPGCNEYAGYVTFTVRADVASFYVEKTAKTAAGEWREKVTAKPGDKVDFQVHYHNSGTMVQRGVTVKDTLGNGMTYKRDTSHLRSVAGDGTVLLDQAQQDTWIADNLGLMIGDYEAGSDAYLTYSVMIDDDERKFPCDRTTTIYNEVALATPNGTMYDAVEVGVEGKPCAETANSMPKTGGDFGELIMSMLIGLAMVGGFVYMACGVRMMHSKPMTEEIRLGQMQNQDQDQSEGEC